MNGRELGDRKTPSCISMKQHPLPKWEYYVYLLLSLGIHFYSFYQVYLSSREHEKDLEEEVGLERDSLFWDLKKDGTDFEWSFWMEWARSRLLWLMLGHAVLSQSARIFIGKYRPWLLMVYGMAACWLVLGTKGFVAILLNSFIFYGIAQMKMPLITWLSSILMLLILHSESVENIQMQTQDTQWPNLTFCGLLADVFRLLLWWCLGELMIHTMYMHAIYSNYPTLEDVSYWTLGGLALAQVLFFYVKYLVLYGLPVLIVQLDGLNAPALPRCVSTMHSFTGIWRSFDVGLHRFLVRYIYIPMGGSHCGLGGMLLSTAFTFIFVCYWHGAHEYLWYWAALNWFGIIIEQAVKKLLTMPSIQDIIDQNVSPKAYRQLHAALASVSTALLIFTNLIFLGGEQVGKIYWDRLIVEGGCANGITIELLQSGAIISPRKVGPGSLLHCFAAFTASPRSELNGVCFYSPSTRAIFHSVQGVH
ncbi:protein-cysteine N-palmitoyltransferase HHAT isoform X7 [Pseudophryne corroboree]|uniref:protein-cysteine N-palmitoyltransferase HHAT isoform X7 n=1 Tax=Pseudophryne corroboree TaxID=495146 RepID=UPI0030818AD6